MDLDKFKLECFKVAVTVLKDETDVKTLKRKADEVYEELT